MIGIVPQTHARSRPAGTAGEPPGVPERRRPAAADCRRAGGRSRGPASDLRPAAGPPASSCRGGPPLRRPDDGGARADRRRYLATEPCSAVAAAVVAGGLPAAGMHRLGRRDAADVQLGARPTRPEWPVIRRSNPGSALDPKADVGGVGRIGLVHSREQGDTTLYALNHVASARAAGPIL